MTAFVLHIGDSTAKNLEIDLQCQSYLSTNTSYVSTIVNITSREKEVLKLIAYEHTAKEIADKLYVSYETVNTHRKNIMCKLGVKNTAGMVRVAYQKQLLSV